jgi:hypothetical protein
LNHRTQEPIVILNRTLTGIAIATMATFSQAADRPIQNDIEYRSGGFGLDEAQDMRNARSDYSLGLTFATQAGAFVADVDVQVRSASGELVLSRQGQGPMVLANVPAGRYTIRTTAEGRSQTHEITVPRSGHRHLVVTW